MNTQGKVFKYPDNVDTDVIIPARYLNTSSAQELAKHCMEDIDKEFVKKVQPGDVIVLCGKGHETYQEIHHVKHHLDEREIVAEYLAAGH